MYRAYHALKSIGQGRDVSEQFDEFPLAYNKEDSDTMQLMLITQWIVKPFGEAQ